MKGRRGGWKGQRSRGRRLILREGRGRLERQAGCQAALRNPSLRYEYSSPSPTVSIPGSLTSISSARAINSLFAKESLQERWHWPQSSL